MTTNNAWNTEYPDTDGELLIGSSSGRALKKFITAGTNVTVNNSAGSIDLQTAPIDDFVVVQRDTASSTAEIDYTCRISDFQLLMLVGNDTQPATSGGLGISCSTDGGSTFDTTTSNYQGVGWEVNQSGSRNNLDDSALAGGKLQIAGSTNFDLGADANETVSFVCYIFKPSNTVFVKTSCYSVYTNDSGEHTLQWWGSLYRNATAVDALRLKQTSGNIGSGEFVMYGAVT